MKVVEFLVEFETFVSKSIFELSLSASVPYKHNGRSKYSPDRNPLSKSTVFRKANKRYLRSLVEDNFPICNFSALSFFINRKQQNNPKSQTLHHLISLNV